MIVIILFFQNIQQCSVSEDDLDSSCIADNERDNESDTEHTSEVITPESKSFVKPSTSATSKPKLLGKRPSSGNLPPKRIKLGLPCTKPLPNRFENSINKLQKIAEMVTTDTEDQYDIFGKHIASQMRELPLKSFIILQSKFQNLITEERLVNLYGNYNEPQSQSGVISRSNSTSHHEFIGTTMYSGPENTYSESSSSCYMERESPQDMDILNEALISICKDPEDLLHDGDDNI